MQNCRRWPRVPDARFSVGASSLATAGGAGKKLDLSTLKPEQLEQGFRMVLVPLGSFSNVEYSRQGQDWLELDFGLPLPVDTLFRQGSGGAGGVLRVLGYILAPDEDELEGVANIAHITGAADKGGSTNDLTSSGSQGLKTPAAGGSQITPSSSSVVAFRVVMDQANANPIVAAETQAKAALLLAAGGGAPTYAAGLLVWPISQGALWLASSTGTENCYVLEDFA